MSDFKDKIKKGISTKTNVDLTDKISELEQQVAEHLHGWKKALADYQNLQKESAQKTAGLTNFITSALVLELLPIFDNYHTAIDHIPAEQKDEAGAVGFKHI